MDYLMLRVELSSRMTSEKMRKLLDLEETIRRRVHAIIGLTSKVKLVEPRTLRDMSAAERVIDNRESA